MTTAQVKYILNKRGYSLDTWTPLASFDTISTMSDNSLHVSPGRVFYFGSDGNLYVKRVAGSPVKYDKTIHGTPNENQVLISYEGTQYIMSSIYSKFSIDDIGTVHRIIPFDQIQMITRVKRRKQ